MFRRLPFALLSCTFVALLPMTECAAAGTQVEFRVSGVLISGSGRSALVNGELARAGEKINGVEILSIDKDGVRVLSGSAEYTVPIGSRAMLAPTSGRPPAFQDLRTRPPGIRQVRNGDTLSEIAEDYAGAGASLQQVMVALFEANPGAFRGNINRLRAGATLHIPAAIEFQRHTSEAALAEVHHQVDVWRQRHTGISGTERPKEATPEMQHEYGPVRFGETLSGIAVKLASKEVPMQRMMVALFEANPHAFGSSMDMLREGAVLNVPLLAPPDPAVTLAANMQ